MNGTKPNGSVPGTIEFIALLICSFSVFIYAISSVVFNYLNNLYALINLKNSDSETAPSWLVSIILNTILLCVIPCPSFTSILLLYDESWKGLNEGPFSNCLNFYLPR